MRKIVSVFLCLGLLNTAFAYGDIQVEIDNIHAALRLLRARTPDAGAFEIEVNLETGFAEGSDAGPTLAITYGITDRFSVELGMGWLWEVGNRQNRGFDHAELGLMFFLIPDILAIRPWAVFNTGEVDYETAIFGGELVANVGIPTDTEFSLALGFESNGLSQSDINGRNVMTWGFQVGQSFGQFSVGAEILGILACDCYVFDEDGNMEWRNWGADLEWTIGLGYTFNNNISVGIGLMGDFESNEALGLNIGFVFGIGGNGNGD